MPWSRCVSNIFEFVLLQTKFGHLRQPGHLTLWKKLAEKHLVSPKSYENPHIAGRYKISQSSCFSWQSVNEFLSFFWGFHDEVWDLFFFCWRGFVGKTMDKGGACCHVPLVAHQDGFEMVRNCKWWGFYFSNLLIKDILPPWIWLRYHVFTHCSVRRHI